MKTYAEFWPYYLDQHRDPTCRRLHLFGMAAGLSCLAAAVALKAPGFAAAAPVAGYVPAWIGHFFFERNTPATFRHPLWSLRADFHMNFLSLTGRPLRPRASSSKIKA